MSQPFPRLRSLVLSIDLSGQLLSDLLDPKAVELTPSLVSRFHHSGCPFPNSGNSSWRGSVCDDARGRRLLGRALKRRLARLAATSCSIGEPFALGAFDGAIGAFQVIDPEGNPVVVPEIEFGGVAVQMRLADVE